MYKVFLFVFFLAVITLIKAQSSESSSPISVIPPTPAASGAATISGGSASNAPASSAAATLSPSSPNTVNLTTQAPFTPSPSPLPGSQTLLSTPIVSSTAPTAVSANPSASPIGSGSNSTGASSESSAATASSSSGVSTAASASSVASASSNAAVSASSAASASSGATSAASNSAVAATASNSPAPPSYVCYCDWYEIPTLQKVPNYNSSFDYSHYSPGNLYYGQQVSSTLNYMAVSASQAQDRSGVVDIFTRFANFPFWTYRTTLYPTTTNVQHFFGSFMTMLNDANVLVIETSPRPRFYSFERSAPATWIQVQPNFLLNVSRVTAMDAKGTLMVIAYNSGARGAVAIYNKIGYNWTFVISFLNPEGNIFYTSVSVGAGNQFAAVTSNTAGSVHVFTKTNAGVWNQPQVVSIDPNSGSSYFGAALRTVAASADRSTIAVGSSKSVWLMSAFANRTFPSDISQVTGYNSEILSIPFTNVNSIRISGGIMAVADNSVPAGTFNRSFSPCTPQSSQRSEGAIFVYQRIGIQANPSSVFQPQSQEPAFGNSLSLSTNQGNIIVAGGGVDTIYTFIEQSDVAIPVPCEGYYQG